MWRLWNAPRTSCADRLREPSTSGCVCHSPSTFAPAGMPFAAGAILIPQTWLLPQTLPIATELSTSPFERYMNPKYSRLSDSGPYSRNCAWTCASTSERGHAGSGLECCSSSACAAALSPTNTINRNELRAEFQELEGWTVMCHQCSKPKRAFQATLPRKRPFEQLVRQERRRCQWTPIDSCPYLTSLRWP